MSTSDTDPQSGFVDLSRIDQVRSVEVHSRGSIIRETPDGTSAEPKMSAGDSHAPEVVLHRSGDEVTSIEFVCSCGQHATVRIEYDDK